MSLRASFEKGRALASYFAKMGPVWTFHRVRHEVRRRDGYFRRGNARIVKSVRALEGSGYPLAPLQLFGSSPPGDARYADKAQAAMAGRIFAFSSRELDYGAGKGGLRWNLNPLTGREAPDDREWQEIPDFAEFGDIKAIWEASRFPQAFYFIQAHRATGDSAFGRACLSQMTDWCLKNPYPFGPNHKCGQETSFRLFLWSLALAEFRQLASPEQLAQIGRAVYASALRIELNIDYARRSVKNNHSISEACGMILAGLWCSALPEAPRLLERGLSILERELSYQVFDDGSYIQHSFNYERLALDTLSFLLILLKRIGHAAPDSIIAAHRKMERFLAAFVRPDGRLPNYGANDGAYLFPANARDYADFRPSLALAAAARGEGSEFGDAGELTDFFGLRRPGIPGSADKKGDVAFEAGGYYGLRAGDAFVFFRSHEYRTRPSQCDLHHVDFWVGDRNVFTDSGSLSYGAAPELRKSFDGSLGHNVIRIDRRDPMSRVLKFGWSEWAASRVVGRGPGWIRSELTAYRDLFSQPLIREIRLEPGKLTVIDRIPKPSRQVHFEQIWNSPFGIRPSAGGFELEKAHCRISSTLPGHVGSGLRSARYLESEPASRLVFAATLERPAEVITVIES